jgi:magnesium and cobalt transporter
MSEDRDTELASESKSWLERLSQLVFNEPRTRDDLVEILREAQRNNLINADALSMVEGVLQVTEMQVRDIMIPRAQMTVISRNATQEEMLATIVSSGHSRFAVIGDSRDEVIGIFLAKDMLRLFASQASPEHLLREVMRPAFFVPESKRLDVLLKEFRANRNHLAVVVDEYGGVAGMVTIEDVLEQIVGDIDDEHDIDEGTYILKHGAGRFMVKALTPIEDFNDYFGTAFSDEEFDTIGGCVAHVFGRLPKRGEAKTIGRHHFQIIRSDNRRIHLLMVADAPASPTSD